MMSEREILESCACNKVRKAARAVTRAYDDVLRPTGLRITQLLVLVAMSGYGAITITGLAKVLGMDRSTLTRNLGPLEKEGLAVIGTEGWHRSRTLEISRKGRECLKEALPLWEKAQSKLKRSVGERNWSGVHGSLDRLINT